MSANNTRQAAGRTLVATGFLTDNTLEAQGAAAAGLLTTRHYADSLNLPCDSSCITAVMPEVFTDTARPWT